MNTRIPDTRQERKQRTRQDLLDAALRLLEDQSFSSLGLRQVTREAGVVPTAFYRHFETMEELGLVLIDESMRSLREMIRDVRSESPQAERVIRESVDILVRHVRANRPHFRFIARERVSGVASLRHAIRTEIRLFASELATDLARFPQASNWSTEDLHVMGGLFVNAMVSIVDEVLDAPPNSPAAEADIRRQAEKQLRMIALAVPVWRSRPDAG